MLMATSIDKRSDRQNQISLVFIEAWLEIGICATTKHLPGTECSETLVCCFLKTERRVRMTVICVFSRTGKHIDSAIVAADNISLRHVRCYEVSIQNLLNHHLDVNSNCKKSHTTQEELIAKNANIRSAIHVQTKWQCAAACWANTFRSKVCILFVPLEHRWVVILGWKDLIFIGRFLGTTYNHIANIFHLLHLDMPACIKSLAKRKISSLATSPVTKMLLYTHIVLSRPLKLFRNLFASSNLLYLHIFTIFAHITIFLNIKTNCMK